MSPRRQALFEVLLMFFVLTMISLFYVVWTWPTSPMEVMGDLDRLGPAAFLLDLIFVFNLCLVHLPNLEEVKTE